MLPKERAEIEQLIGRLIDERDRASLRDLNSLPRKLQEDLERLAPMQRAGYLRFLVGPEDHRFLKRFAEDVFDLGIDAANWRRGGALFPRFTERELLRLEVSEILAPLRWVEGESWWRKQPLLRLWEGYDDSVGQPLLLRPELTYRDSEPPHVGRHFPPFLLPQEPVADPEVATRRWVATRIAQRARANGGLLGTSSVADLLRRAGFEEMPISVDAATALSALQKELSSPGLALDAPPGFRGPDEWYTPIPRDDREEM